MTPAGIEPAIFRFLAQHLNHHATEVPRLNRQTQTHTLIKLYVAESSLRLIIAYFVAGSFINLLYTINTQNIRFPPLLVVGC